MTFSELAQQRLVHQQMAETALQSAPEMVEWFGAVQGQEYAQTKWGLGLRLPSILDKDIESDLSSGKIIRTHLLRPTWHFVSAKDICWLLLLTAPRVHAANAYMYRSLELDDKVFNKCHDILIETLQGGKQLTREKINEKFKKERILATGHRLSYIMMQAELEGLICSGARQGKQFTYALLEERVLHKCSLTKEEALAELTKRYFRSRGPATARDFATWSGLTLTDCKRGIEMHSPALCKVRTEGHDDYFTDYFRSLKAVNGVFLLPIYDEFIMGYKDRNAYFEIKNKLKPVPAFRFDSMIVAEGQVIGTWSRTMKQHTIVLDLQLFKSLTKSQTEWLNLAINRLSEFTGLRAEYAF